MTNKEMIYLLKNKIYAVFTNTYLLNEEKDPKLDYLKVRNLLLKLLDKDTYDYDITLNNENNLNIKYEVNDNTNVIINGNGNFNKSNNLIEIKVGDKIYNIHAHKTIKVSYTKDKETIKEMSSTKKEIVKVLIITISCSLVFLFYKFISKIQLHILHM